MYDIESAIIHDMIINLRISSMPIYYPDDFLRQQFIERETYSKFGSRIAKCQELHQFKSNYNKEGNNYFIQMLNLVEKLADRWQKQTFPKKTFQFI